jgi:hypothetical protein
MGLHDLLQEQLFLLLHFILIDTDKAIVKPKKRFGESCPLPIGSFRWIKTKWIAFGY